MVSAFLRKFVAQNNQLQAMMEQKKWGLCADHAGYEMKEYVKALLLERGLEVLDFGTHSEERCDYPDPAHDLGRAIDAGELERGVAVCGSGNGISMALNKHPRVRAALSWNAEIAALARQHNDANVLSIPGRFVSRDECRAIVDAFLEATFEGGRHTRRVAKIPLQG